MCGRGTGSVSTCSVKQLKRTTTYCECNDELYILQNENLLKKCKLSEKKIYIDECRYRIVFII